MGQGERAAAGRPADNSGLRARFIAPDFKTRQPGGGQGRRLLPAGGIDKPFDKPKGRSAEGRPALLPDDIAFLAASGVPEPILAEAARISHRKRLPASEVLIARGWIARAVYGELVARNAGFAHAASLPNGIVANFEPRERDVVGAEPLLVHTQNGSVLCAADEPGEAKRLGDALGGRSRLQSRILMVPAMALRMARHMANAGPQSQRAAFGLARRNPRLSAFRRLSRGQAVLFLLAIPVLLLAALGDDFPVAPAAGLFMTCFYLAAVFLRAMMIWRLDDVPRYGTAGFRPATVPAEELPRYSILVALYREAGQVGALVSALAALEWPADRREILLICEEDDRQTHEAIGELDLPEGFHLVICPPSTPRTKPKALNFALPLASGDYTVIYDAEDRPHPFQLREAHERFSKEGPHLACLQAPLEIHNGGDNWLTAMFAIEYQTLFRGMLPVLESLGGPLPLGGTSNHFRTATLRQAGEWDPWNVTEDADLGVRLARLGHFCGTLTLPTLEEAPPRVDIWLRQRTRWLKGWIQTILVHSRNPVLMLREIGWRRTLLFHLVLTSIVASALAHPVFLALLALEAGHVVAGGSLAPAERLFFGLAMFNLAGGYTTYAFFAREVLMRSCARQSPLLLLTLPVYWLLISIAGWRAAWQFITDPFRWEKTEHGLSKNKSSANMPSRNSNFHTAGEKAPAGG
jgi:cellulose synthase/poly-beta-1,6-N-acetylglucosamine synthase-like glycosyltransferase